MRLRLFLSFALVSAATILVMVIVARQGNANEVRAFMVHGGMAGSGRIVRTLEDYYAANRTWDGAQQLFEASHPGGQGNGWRGGQGMGNGMSMMSPGMMNQSLRLADANGQIVAGTDPEQASGQASQAELAQSLPLAMDGQTVGYLLIEGGMTYTPDDEQFLLGRLNRAALAAGAISATVGLLLALLLAYSLLRPVRALTQAAQQLGQGDLSQRVTVRGQDELSTLGVSFNTMADSLQQAEASRQALTADIAHELRNPLAVQRANLEAMQDGVYPLTPENLQPVLEQNLLLTRLVEDLRTLALAESGHLKLERTEVHLPDLVRRVLERFGAQAAARQVNLDFAEPLHPLPAVQADPIRLEQILNNLLSNALRYTPDGGQIELVLNQTRSGLQLQVQDSGPGIPPEALPRLFDRFYRADKSRSRSEGGTGLGLAIARQLAQAHGGSLAAANRSEGGAVFTLILPTGANSGKIPPGA